MPSPTLPSDSASGRFQHSRFSRVDVRLTAWRERDPLRTSALWCRRNWRSIRQLSAQKIADGGCDITMVDINRSVHRAHVIFGNPSGQLVESFTQLGTRKQDRGPDDRHSVVRGEIAAVVAQ